MPKIKQKSEVVCMSDKELISSNQMIVSVDELKKKDLVFIRLISL